MIWDLKINYLTAGGLKEKFSRYKRNFTLDIQQKNWLRKTHDLILNDVNL